MSHRTASRNGKTRRSEPGRNGRPANKSSLESIYRREDVALFRTVQTLSQLAGVSQEKLRRLVAKELADNSLDAGAKCEVGYLDHGDGFFVQDDGPGIPGGPEDIADIFSFGRTLASSKLKRLPLRGALGNGLRVVAGAAYASRGTLRVITNGWDLRLEPEMSGTTRIRSRKPTTTTGTRVEVRLGDGIPEDTDTLGWARDAIAWAGKTPIYAGKSSPWWFDSDSFCELLRAAGSRSVRDVLQDFDPAASSAAGKFAARRADALSEAEADALLDALRQACEPVPPKRLALLGSDWSYDGYAKSTGTIQVPPGRGRFSAQLPCTVEAWCGLSVTCGGQLLNDNVLVLVNRTPATGDVSIERADEKHEVIIFGCNLGYRYAVGRKPVRLVVNVQIPFMPITSNGKEPDLEWFLDDVRTTIEAAAKKCRRANPSETPAASGIMPAPLPRGRPGEEARAKRQADEERFADRLREIASTVDFRMSARGFCYVLENLGELSKGDFDKAEGLITELRKSGLIPLDLVAEDEARLADHLEAIDPADPRAYAEALAGGIDSWADDYLPVSFWDNQPNFVQVVVEKIDLKSLFSPVCREYRVPLVNGRGWSDLNLKVALMRRFAKHEAAGRKPVLLYCGDHDPVGLTISERLPEHLAELEHAVGWSPRNLVIERFGLNADFIERHGLPWIEGLETSSGADLADPNHKHHKFPYVQDYIRKFGARKVEANALVIRPDDGRQLCRDAIEKYLNLDAIPDYERKLAERRGRFRKVLPEVLREYVRRLGRK